MAFARQIQESVPIISQLLGSKNTSDVLESIEFFVTSYEFGLSVAIIGIRRMLVLIWSKEQGVKDIVVAAYKKLYLESCTGSQRWITIVLLFFLIYCNFISFFQVQRYFKQDVQFVLYFVISILVVDLFYFINPLGYKNVSS